MDGWWGEVCSYRFDGIHNSFLRGFTLQLNVLGIPSKHVCSLTCNSCICRSKLKCFLLYDILYSKYKVFFKAVLKFNYKNHKTFFTWHLSDSQGPVAHEIYKRTNLMYDVLWLIIPPELIIITKLLLLNYFLNSRKWFVKIN